MNKNKPIIAERIKSLRKEKGFTQEQLAKILGLNAKSSIANYESGANSPSDDVKKKMCELFDCSIDYLMGKSEFKTQNSESSLENIKKFYEEKINTLLKNKYINEFSKLNLSDSETENLIQILTSDDKEITENYNSLLNSFFSILSLNHNKIILDKIQQLVIDYTQEKLNILTEEMDVYKKRKEKSEEKMKKAHIDKLHPAISGKSSASLEENISALLDYMDANAINQFYMCPVYGNISAGQPNWAEECLEGYLPIDPNIMNIINPEECFFLRVNGESMNKLIRNGAYALIRKQDVVENGEIAAVLVNGYDATLKKFTQHNDVIVLEPMSNDPSFQTQIYDKNTEIKILGKYIGKFEINN